MKHTKTTCDYCQKEVYACNSLEFKNSIGGVTKVDRFILKAMRYDGIEFDICKECRDSTIIKWADGLKSQGIKVNKTIQEQVSRETR